MISRALCKNQDPGEELGELEEQREREREREREQEIERGHKRGKISGRKGEERANKEKGEVIPREIKSSGGKQKHSPAHKRFRF